MRKFAFTLGLVSAIALMLCMSQFSVVKAARDEPLSYTATVSIRGLPESLNTTVYLDGHVYGKYRGGVTLKFHFTEGTTHTVSVDRVVNASSGVSYVCESNVATFVIPGPEYPFNYNVVEPIPELGSPVLVAVTLAIMMTIYGICKNRFRVNCSSRKMKGK